MQIAVGVLLGAGAFGCWLFAVFHWIKAVRRRRPEISLSALLTQGFKSFDPSSFTPEGAHHQKQFVRGTLLFVGFIVCGIVAGVLFSRT
jgi:hypothetical protein